MLRLQPSSRSALEERLRSPQPGEPDPQRPQGLPGIPAAVRLSSSSTASFSSSRAAATKRAVSIPGVFASPDPVQATSIKSKRAGTNEEHTVNRKRFRKEAEAIDAFRAPEIPVAVYLEEGGEAVWPAEKHREALEAVSMPADLPGRLGGYLDGLQGSQAIWRAENGERASDLETASEQAVEVKREASLACELALRDSPDGQRLLEAVEEGNAPPQLVASLTDLSMIASRFRPEFEAIHVSADELAARLAAHAGAVQQAHYAEDAGSSAAEAKELRDRYYTLTLKPVVDLRAYAQFAFRNDKNPRRRKVFMSKYVQARNRKSYRKEKAAGVGVDVPARPAADDTLERPEAMRDVA